MANQIEVPKLNQLAAIGALPSEEAVGKLVMFVLLEPGGGVDTSNRQGHVHTQIIVRAT